MLAQTIKLGSWSLALLLPGLASGRNSSQFLNPILPGFHPDPSCTFIPKEDTFYCASSSFNAFPGIPIHASKDLTTWRLVGEFLPCSICPPIDCWLTTCNYRRGGPSTAISTLLSDTPHVLAVWPSQCTPCFGSSHLRYVPYRPPVFSSHPGACVTIGRGEFQKHPSLLAFASRIFRAAILVQPRRHNPDSV
jgi:hypothetical protein